MKVKFSGALGKKRAPRTLGIIDSKIPELHDKYAKLWAVEDLTNLNHLFDHFAIDRGDYLGLSLALAELIVPAFQEKKKIGRKEQWTDEAIGRLVIDMESRIEKGNRSKGAAWAAKQLASDKLWSDFVSTCGDADVSNTAEVLRVKYSRFRESDIATYAREVYQLTK